jgi:tetratricopeptide (TPR) repeat protein
VPEDSKDLENPLKLSAEPVDTGASHEGQADSVESAPPAAQPLIFVPVEASDMLRRRRRLYATIAVILLVSVALAAYLYRRSVDPIHAQESYDAGVRLLKIARYPQAILAFDRAVNLKSDYWEAYLMRGRAFLADNQTERASREFTKVIELRPNDPGPLIERGLAYVEMHDYQTAIVDANKAIDIDPKLATAYNLRGTAIRAMGNPQAALKDFDEAVKLAPVELNYFERAATYQLLGEHRKAIADYTELIAFRPDFAPGYFARAKSERAIGDFKGAKADHEAGRILDGR